MHRGRGLGVGAGCFIAFVLAAPGASAATITVNNLQDPSGPGHCSPTPPRSCSLRQAIGAAQNGDTVSVPAGTYQLTQQSLLTISTNLTLTGAGARATIIKQTVPGADVLNNLTSTVTVQGVTITGGDAGGGSMFASQGAVGGGISNGGALTLVDSAVTGNRTGGYTLMFNNTQIPFPGWGGGIYTNGPLKLIRSTVAGNTASLGTGSGAEGGGIYSMGTANSQSSVTVINSTITDNLAQGGSGAGQGGGIYMAGTYTPQLTLANATVAFNSVTSSETAGGGNLFFDNSSAAVSSLFKNSIIADGSGPSGTENCQGVSATSEGYNLEDQNQCGFTGTGDRHSIAAKLEPLENNGGSTDTVALMPGGPAINGGSPSGCTDAALNALLVDQRGFGRPQGMRCDIGAFEFRVPALDGAPRVSGTPKVGDKLTCLLPAIQSPDGPATHAVSWLRNGTPVASGDTYVVRGLDKAHRLSCRLTAMNSAGSAQATSRAVTVH